MTKYRVYVAGPTSILELCLTGINPNESGIEEDGNYWLDDLMVPPERLIAIVNEDHVLSARDLSHAPADSGEGGPVGSL